MSTARRPPSINAPGALGVFDGQARAGTIVKQGSEYFAFDAAGHCIGVFDSQPEAVRKIPRQREAAS
jgi:hypothetical protein